MRKVTIPIIVLGLFSSIASANDVWNNGFDLRLGVMKATNSTEIGLSGANRAADIDLEGNLNLEDDNFTGRLGLDWRFKDRHVITAEIYQVRRDGAGTAKTDFSFDIESPVNPGQVIPVDVEGGAKVDSKLNVDIFDITYGYSFIQNKKHHLSGSVGLYWMEIDQSLRASGDGKITIDGSIVANGKSADSRVEVGAPMPLFGFLYEYAATPEWLFSLNSRYFSVSIDPYSGSIANVDFSTTYYWDNFYLGGGLTWVDLQVEVDKSNWRGGIDWSFKGPHLFIGSRF